MLPNSAADLFGQVGRAVGAAVVHDENAGVGQGRTHSPQDAVDVLRFVVGGYDDQGRHEREA